MATQAISPDSIKAAVREHYGSAVTSAGACCGGGCGCDCGCADTASGHYSAELLAELPAGVSAPSFGCGNPIALATLRPGEVVLDLGSGGGLDVLLAAQRVGPQGYVYGVDMTDAMLEVARRNAERAAATNVAFLKGDIEAIPLPQQAVDVIISNCVVNLAPDKTQVLHEAFRVLRPGGRLAISDIVVDGDLENLAVGEQQIRSAMSWAGCIAGALTRQQYQDALVAAGFTDVSIEVTQRYTPADLDMLGELPASLRELEQASLDELVGRFTSCAITARRP